MKRILPLLTIVLSLTTSTVLAAPIYSAFAGSEDPSSAFDYEVKTVPYTGQVNQGNDWEYFKIKINEGKGRIYIVDFMNSPDWDTSESLTDYGISRYGYYDVNGKDIYYTPTSSDIVTTNVSEAKTIVLQTMERTDAGQTFYRYGYDLGKEFEAGDEVGIWVERYGQSAGSYTAVPYQNASRYRVNPDSKDQWALANNYIMPVAEFTVNGQMRFGLFFSASEPIVGGGGKPVGAPLPGGFSITLVAGFFALGFWYIRRRRSIAV